MDLKGWRETGECFLIQVRAETLLFFVSPSIKHHKHHWDQASPVKGQSHVDGVSNGRTSWTVSDNGWLSDCTVVTEKPQGSGLEMP